MAIIITKHKENLNKRKYVVTIEDNGNVILDKKNIGCELKEDGTLDIEDLHKRISTLVLSYRTATPQANVNIDMG